MLLKNNFVGRVFLQIFAKIWEFITWGRRVFYISRPVQNFKRVTHIISVGNLSSGGTGKTPVIAWIINYYNKTNKRLLILTRGYKSELEKSCGIIQIENGIIENEELIDPKKFGDEPVLLARKIQRGAVIVGRNRVKNLETFLCSSNFSSSSSSFDNSSDVILLDDGFQHLKIARDLDIVMIDAMADLKDFKIFPLGMLREGPEALKHADIVLLSRSDLVDQEKIQLIKSLVYSYTRPNFPIAEIFYRPLGLFNTDFKQVMSWSELDKKKCICITALAGPSSFYEMLQRQGVIITKKYNFPDHYSYKEEDILSIINYASAADEMMITTEKDIVKIRKLRGAEKIFYVAIEVAFSNGENLLRDLIYSLHSEKGRE
jgi:tetraacyldisaccharide 4'-kinase